MKLDNDTVQKINIIMQTILPIVYNHCPTVSNTIVHEENEIASSQSSFIGSINKLDMELR